MRCPIDRSDLTVVERHGVDVRLCPICQGVWLSDSDLDVIVGNAIAGTTDDLDVDTDRRTRRRDKYSDDFDLVERPRKSKSRRSGRAVVEDYADY